MSTYIVKQHSFSGQNLIIAPSYLSMDNKGKIGLNWAKIGPITIRDKFENIFEVYSLSQAIFVFWSELNSSSFRFIQSAKVFENKVTN